MAVETEEVQQLLPIYYQRLFPFKRFIDWLSYGNAASPSMQNREFSFTIRHMGQEVYIRFQSFGSKADFKKEILAKCPEKIDIGAVYTGKPKMKNSLKLFKPVQRELVFDIDMTDYDDIRTCCQGAAVCNKCWKFMNIAIKLLDYALRDCFGFQHILYVFSGRRGIHCWICDERARNLSEEIRKAVVGFLEVVKGGEQKVKKVSFSGNLHPYVDTASRILKEYFEQVVLVDQDILAHEEKENQMLEIIPQPFRDEVADVWKKTRDSLVKWDTFVELCKDHKKFQNLPMEIMFQYLYPRLDAQVSMHLNHLLKAPFCIHPKTGRICVPIRVDECESFDPLAVPTVKQLINEINDYDAANGVQTGADGDDWMESGDIVEDWEKTSMKPYIAIFDEFQKGMELERRNEMAQKRMEEDKKLLF